MFYKQVDRIFSPSRWYIDDLENMGIEPGKMDILERWIDTTQFSPEKRDPNYWESNAPLKLLFVGRISKDKNVDVLVELYQQLAPKYPDFVLHVVGDGPYFHEAEKDLILPRFIMTGAKFKEDLAQAYASSDLFVYPGLL